MSERRLFVTGIGGFVGPYVVRAARARGYAVHGVGNQPSTPAIRELLEDETIVDLRDAAALAEVIADAEPTAIVHLAGQSSVGRSFEEPTLTYEVNAAGTWNLLEAMRRARPKARLLSIGSADIYGPQPTGTRVREDAKLNPVSPYGLSKAIADAACVYYADQFGLDLVRTRSFAHIGAGQADRFVVPALARQVCEIENGLREPEIRVGNLEVTRDLTNVESVAEGYLALLERGRTGAAYNVCSGRGVKLSELAERLVRRARVHVAFTVDPERMRSVDIPYLVGDPEAIARDTGWKAEVALDDALDEILREWRARIAESRSAAF